MKRLTYILPTFKTMLALGIVLFFFSCQSNLSQVYNTLPYEKIAGTWIDNEYLNILKNTRDPRKSFTVRSVPLLEVAKEANGIAFKVCYNFHEGWPVLIDSITQTSPDEWSFKISEPLISGIKLKIVNADTSLLVSLTSTDSLHKPLPFKSFSHFAGGYQSILDSIVLSGEFTNESGELISFLNGRINWPLGNCRFQVCYDYIEDYGSSFFNTINESGTKILDSYAFKWEGNNLFISLIDEEAHTVGKQLMTLTPKK